MEAQHVARRAQNERPAVHAHSFSSSLPHMHTRCLLLTHTHHSHPAGKHSLSDKRMASHHHYSSISGGLALAFGGPSSASTPLFAAAGQDGEHGGDNSSLASLLEVRRGPSASPQHGSPTLTTFDRAFDKAAADEPTAKRLHATQPVAEMGGRQQQSDRGWYERDEEGQELEVRDCDAQEPGEQEEGEEDEDTQQQAAEEPPQLTNTISNGLLM